MIEGRAVQLGDNPASITLHSPDPASGSVESMSVTMRFPDLEVTRRVYMRYGWGRHVSLMDYFAGLATEWRGWDGSREWTSLEGDFRLTAHHDRVGNVVIQVGLGLLPPLVWHEAGWSMSAIVRMDPGQLGPIADSLGHFLADD